MKILHITPTTNGYEEVILLANKISRTNNFALIQKNGEKFMTGGFLLIDTPKIREMLDMLPKETQYELVKSFKMDPYVKFYADDEDMADSIIIK